MKTVFTFDIYSDQEISEEKMYEALMAAGINRPTVFLMQKKECDCPTCKKEKVI